MIFKTFKTLVRPFADKCSLYLLRFGWIDRIVGFLNYQRRRVTRRKIESRLRGLGLYGDVVMKGPFKGMRYPPPESWAADRFEKIIGAYEFENFDMIEGLLKRNKQYKKIYVIGAAEGFYAVGLAMVFPAAQIVAFEPIKQKTDVLRQMAEINKVSDRIVVEGFCDLERLSSMEVTEKALVVCDVDGYEQELLKPASVPWFKFADFIVELHDCFIPGISDVIRNRFSPSHTISEFKQTGLPYEQYPILETLDLVEIGFMVGSERKSLQNWFLMEPAQQ